MIADDVITLQLETPELSKPSPELQAKATTSVSKPKVNTFKGKVAPRQMVARIAIVTAEHGAIYASRSTKSKAYSICLKDTSLAVINQSGSWFGVLMVDGSIGWIQASKISLLDYTASLPLNSINRGSYASRGHFDGRGYESGSPIVQTALQYLGVPYVYGGNSTASGIDCSAFVKTVYSQYGINLPRTAREQANVGEPVTGNEIQPGDRLYFSCKHNYVDHCGIYIGNGYFIHASASRGGVAVDSLSKKFYSDSLVAIMR